MSEETLMTYAQAADHLGMRVGTLYSMVSRREIPHVRIGRRIVRFSTTDLQSWLSSKRVGAGSQDGV